METFLSSLFTTYSFVLFFVGLATGFVGAIGGSSGLILVPFMIASGMTPALALGTARFAAMPAWIIAVRKFHQNGQVRWRSLGLLTLLAVIAGVIGTTMMIKIDQNYVLPFVGIVLLLAAPLSLLKQDFGLVTKEKSRQSLAFGYLAYFLAMLYGGFFGAGSVPLTLYVLVSFFGFRALEAHATQKVAWIVMSVFSSAVFIYHGQVVYAQALVIFISMSIGSFFGARVAIKGGDKWIKWITSLFAFGLGVSLLLGG